MPGLFSVIGDTFYCDVVTNHEMLNKIISRDKNVNDVYIKQNTIDKFIDDKVFEENDNYFAATEGVLLNTKELKEKYKENTLFETLVAMYRSNGDKFIEELRGSFSGLFYDKKNDKKIVFTDHIGSKQIFWSKIDSRLVFSSEVNYLVQYYKYNKLTYNLSEKSSYHLLTFGFMIEENTLFREFKKLLPGHFLLIQNGEIEVKQYFLLDNTPNYEQNEDEIINNIDLLFKKAVRRAFEKDIEYGYKHLVGLSGGLDSRMTTWVANSLGYGENIVNFTFSQSDYLDETIPKKIASDLHHEWIFKFLDNGTFLKTIDEVVKINSGGALYYGLAHSKSCLDLIDDSKFGIVHTGQLGDVVVGTFFSSLDDEKNYSLTDGAYSCMLISKVTQEDIKNDYKNEEIFKFYTRCFTGANQGLLIAQQTNETYSPFYDIDFMSYCLTIPVKYRFRHGIYKKWILSKYPKAANYKWEKIDGTIKNLSVVIMGREVLMKNLPEKLFTYLLRKTGIRKDSIATKHHMNPLDYWYKTNHSLRSFMDDYFKSNIMLLDRFLELKRDCEFLYSNGTNVEKNQVLTLLSVMKLYFGEN